MHLQLIARLVTLLAVANGTPLLVNRVLGPRFAFPIDGGQVFFDGQPLLGASKTLRGIIFASAATTAVAPLIGLTWKAGLAVGVAAMAGDLFSSFLKRRMHFVASSRATGLDQIPESLFPLLACRAALSLTAADITVAVAIFFFGEVLLSLLFYRLHLRERPY